VLTGTVGFRSHYRLSDAGLEGRAKLAKLFGYRLLRGPRREDEHAQFADEAIEDFRKQKRLETAEQERACEYFMSDTYRCIQMLRIGPTAASVLASMHGR
jgi:hypothetical protein